MTKLISATRGVFADTLLAKSLPFMPGHGFTLVEIEHNTEGLSKLYNQYMSPETMIFIHDDVVVCDFWWHQVVEEGLKHYDIVGVAGNRRVFPGQRSWYMAEFNEGPDSVDGGLSGAIAS